MSIATATPAPTKLGTRAVLRTVEPGGTTLCTKCGEWVKFHARKKTKQVICNVYVGGRWDRVEQFHENCYYEAGEPHGTPS
jgi:hypothetical protein